MSFSMSPFPLRFGSRQGGGGGFTPHFWVDSENGDDGNDGTSAEAAFQTLGAAETAALSRGNGTKIGLVAGSSWRGELALGSLTGVEIRSVGTGNPPIINAADIATGWTQPDGATYPNVWYIPSWISDLVNSNYALTVWEDGLEMPNVASLATLNSTPGASFITTSPDGDDALYIHALDSGNPNSNGKVYEASKRISCIYTDTANEAALVLLGPVELRNSSWVSGALVTNRGATLRRGLIKRGRRAIFLSSGLVEDFIFSGSTPRQNSGTSNMLVFYASSPAGSYPGAVRRCGFLAGPRPDQTTYESVSGVFSHNDQAGVVHNCTTEQCWFVSIAGLGGFRGGTHRHTGIYSKDSGSLNLEAASVATPIVEYSLFNGGVGNSNLSSWDAVHDFRHCVSFDAKMLRTGDGFAVTNSVWWKEAGANALTSPLGGGVPNLDVNYSVIVTENWYPAIDMSASTAYSGDFNIFASYFTGRQARFRYNGVENTSAGATQYKLQWWIDQTGEDANSVYILPADQTRGASTALWLGVANDENDGPVDGDFRINPTAKVYGGDDTPYVGTFADGTTPITAVGPQFHWDWNARAVADGPPTRWPTVPETEEEAEAYNADPSGWDFYP